MPRKWLMLKSRDRQNDAATGRRGEAETPLPVPASPRLPVFFLLISVALTGAGCRRDMQDQPKMKPFRGTTFFADGLSGRQPIQGTVPRGFLREESAYFTGK